MKRLLLALAGAGILAAGVATAAAPEAGRAWGGRGGGGPLTHLCEAREARLAGILAFAEERLGITDEQRDAWQSFEQQVTGSTGPTEQLCEQLRTAERPSSLPERLARYELVAEAGLDQIRELRPAVEAMYAELTPEQQEIADTLMRRGHRGHHRR